MVRQVRVEAAEDVERVVIAPVREQRQTEPRELAAEDAEVVRDIVADDDASRGKGTERTQDFFGLLAITLQQCVADLVHLVAVSNRAACLQEALELSLCLPVPAEAQAGNLDDLIARRVNARRLDVKDDDILCLERLYKHCERVARAPRILIEVIRDADARPAVGFLRDLAYRARADAPAEAVEDAHEARGIVRVDDEPQEGQRVLDLLPPEELELVEQHEGQPLILRQVTAEIAEVERQVFIVAVAARQDADAPVILDRQLLDLVVDPLRFLREAHRPLQHDGQAVLSADRMDALGVERRDALGEAVLQPCEGRAQKNLRRTVVLRQHDAARMPVALVGAQDGLGVRAAPLVDGLEVIAAEQQAAAAEDARENAVLELARVLHLVDVDVEEAARPLDGDIRLSKERFGLHDEIREVEAVHIVEARIVTRRDCRAPGLPRFEKLAVELVVLCDGKLPDSSGVFCQ